MSYKGSKESAFSAVFGK